MKIIIIEDERNIAADLEETILRVEPGAQIVARLHSVVDALNYFSEHAAPDLLFCDVQLGDGTSFEILSKAGIKAPVIFCTAFDQYALKAFEAHSVDYIVKPFDTGTVERALAKYKDLKTILAPLNHQLILDLLEKGRRGEERILIRYKDKILPLSYDEIALFYLENELIRLVTFEGVTYFVQKSLEELERAAGEGFYRVNRQFLVNKSAIRDLSTNAFRTITVNLKLSFPQKITVSKNKAASFIDWLT